MRTSIAPPSSLIGATGRRRHKRASAPPSFAGETPVERFYEVEHTYTGSRHGPSCKLRLLKDGKPLARASVNIVVGSPYQKPSLEVQER